MRYSRFSLFSCLILMLVLLSGCARHDSVNIPDWDYTPEATPRAAQQPTQIRQETVQSTLKADETFSGYRPYVPGQSPAPASEDTALATQTASTPPTVTPPPLSNGAPVVRVAMLLPLSGPQANLGQAMLNAAQMALFDVGVRSVNIMPYDTQGTANGGRLAAQNALRDGAQLVLGPVFADAVRAAKSTLRYQNVNMIAFSTDWSLTDQRVFIMGFLPFDQIERIVSYAVAHDIKRIAAIAPQTTYGRAIIAAYRSLAQQRGIEITDVLTYDPRASNLSPDLRSFTHYDERMDEATALAEAIKAEKKSASSQERRSLQKEIERIKSEMQPPFDAVLIAAGGDHAVTISNLLSHYDLPPRKVKRLGIGLFDDQALANEFALRDAWFSAPPAAARSNFEARYKAFYKTTPPRLSTLAYDATALAAVLTHNGLQTMGAPAFDRIAITNPNGFAGIDGIFRFLDNGTVERGLAILSFDNNKIIEVDPAPTTFQSQF